MHSEASVKYASFRTKVWLSSVDFIQFWTDVCVFSADAQPSKWTHITVKCIHFTNDGTSYQRRLLYGRKTLCTFCVLIPKVRICDDDVSLYVTVDDTCSFLW
jgi:hypothetical protein